jgi:hypothetical protein
MPAVAAEDVLTKAQRAATAAPVAEVVEALTRVEQILLAALMVVVQVSQAGLLAQAEQIRVAVAVEVMEPAHTADMLAEQAVLVLSLFVIRIHTPQHLQPLVHQT